MIIITHHVAYFTYALLLRSGLFRRVPRRMVYLLSLRLLKELDQAS